MSASSAERYPLEASSNFTGSQLSIVLAAVLLGRIFSMLFLRNPFASWKAAQIARLYRIYLVIVVKFLPETKGKSREEIEALFKSK